MANPSKHDKLLSRSVSALLLTAAACYAISYFFPYWQFTLLAPQYPDGLTIKIFLNHLGGDIHEINGLNHYIGMRSLTEAAVLERAIAAWGLGVVCVSTLAYMLLRRRRFAWIAMLPALIFPVAFMSDSFYWLYLFGNNLDSRAPINIPPFTPTLVGKGLVGQFETFAAPSIGFYLALGAAVLVIAAFLIQRRQSARDPLHKHVNKRARTSIATPATSQTAAAE